MFDIVLNTALALLGAQSNIDDGAFRGNSFIVDIRLDSKYTFENTSKNVDTYL